MNITLVRHAYLDDVTLGRWYFGDTVYFGLAEPWIPSRHGKGGQRKDVDGRESCIPDGIYVLKPHISVKHPKDHYVWCFVNEELGVWAPGTRPKGQPWGRDAVLLHAGTTTDDIEGCELIGKRTGIYGGKPAVFDTQVALRELRALLGMELHTVHIRPTAGTAEVVA